jgi:hypothetical protein
MLKADYTIQEVLELAHQASKNLSDSQTGVWDLPEVSICHHLANELAGLFQGYDVDVELIKDDRRRPDIVIHKRDTNDNNLVIFQAKKNPTHEQTKEDLRKIQETFFREPYLYKYGIFLSIGQLPAPLPDFDQSKIGMVQVHGWGEVTEEEFRKTKEDYDL